MAAWSAPLSPGKPAGQGESGERADRRGDADERQVPPWELTALPPCNCLHPFPNQGIHHNIRTCTHSTHSIQPCSRSTPPCPPHKNSAPPLTADDVCGHLHARHPRQQHIAHPLKLGSAILPIHATQHGVAARLDLQGRRVWGARYSGNRHQSLVQCQHGPQHAATARTAGTVVLASPVPPSHRHMQVREDARVAQDVGNLLQVLQYIRRVGHAHSQHAAPVCRAGHHMCWAWWVVTTGAASATRLPSRQPAHLSKAAPPCAPTTHLAAAPPPASAAGRAARRRCPAHRRRCPHCSARFPAPAGTWAGRQPRRGHHLLLAPACCAVQRTCLRDTAAPASSSTPACCLACGSAAAARARSTRAAGS